jgi:RNA polymerase sigma-70 factor (ECF subfamily)
VHVTVAQSEATVDWERVVREDGPAAWRTACRLLGNRQDAQDCLQDAFADAVRLSRHEAVRNFRSLLQRIVTARAMDRLRHRYRHGPVNPTLQPPPDLQAIADVCAPDPSQQAEHSELLQRLRGALPALGSEQSQAFVLHAIEGWSYQEIADELGLSVGAVGMLLMRARSRLQEILRLSRSAGASSR